MTRPDPSDARDWQLDAGAGDDRTVVAAEFEHEWQASLVRETLLALGIPCVVAGGIAGSFRTEAPGRVKLLVKARDLGRAAIELERRRQEAASIDWSKVDVSGDSEPDESDPADEA